jgi:hypothetical protein
MKIFFLCFLLILISCENKSENTVYDELCFNGVDDDENGLIDCFDPVCEPCTSNATDFHKDAEYDGYENVSEVNITPLIEISGIVFSRQNDGVIWVHNDSGDGPVIYAINLDGELLGKITLSGINAIDWEDISIGEHNGNPSIFIGDFGDNSESRIDYKIYIVPEPVISSDSSFTDYSESNFETVNFTYEDGKSNCEALAISPQNEIYLIQKHFSRYADLYKIETPDTGSNNVATLVGSFDLVEADQVTGMDICSHGKSVVISSYDIINVFTLKDSTDFDTIVDEEMISFYSHTLQQLEAIAFQPVSEDIYFISEGSNETLYKTEKF